LVDLGAKDHTIILWKIIFRSCLLRAQEGDQMFAYFHGWAFMM